jgi:hypothetical protein
MPPKNLLLAISMFSTMAAMSGCTVTTTSNGPDNGCARDVSVGGCVAGAQGYSCSGVSSPDQINGNLSCSDGTFSGGETLYCCVDVTFVSDTCSAAPSVVDCNGIGIGFSCTGTSRPEQSDSSLACSTGVPGAGGSTSYCCASYVASTGDCAEDTSVRGCGDSAIGFSCTGTGRPEDVNSALVCSTGVPEAGETLFCCASGGTAPVVTTPTCSQDANVDCNGQVGYTCLGGAVPTDTDASLSCGAGLDETGGAVGFCCATAPVAACVPDSAVTPGCPQGADGYTCTGGVNPETGTNLLCDMGTAEQGGQGQPTAFCCLAN